MPTTTRERILAAATPLFAREGAAVTMRALGEAAALDNSSLYRHFPSKEALAHAVLERACEALASPLAPLVGDDPPALRTLLVAVGRLAEELAVRPDPARLFLAWVTAAPSRVATGARDDVAAPPARLLLTLADWLTRARRAGVIRRVPVHETTVMVLGGVLLRAATAGCLLADADVDPTSPIARRARVREAAAFVAGALRPLEEELPLRVA